MTAADLKEGGERAENPDFANGYYFFQRLLFYQDILL